MCFGTSRCSHLCVCNIHLQLLLFTGSAQTFCLLLWSSVTFLHSKKQHQNFAKSKCYCSPNPLKLGFALHFLFSFFFLAILSICSHSLSVFTPPQSISSPSQFSFALSHLVLYFPCTTVFLLFELGSSCFFLSKGPFPFALPRLSPFFSGVPYVNSQLRNVS